MLWRAQHFDSLTIMQWHDMLQLRIDVFVVEQNCPYPELDGKDPQCIHVTGMLGDKVLATARIVPPGLTYSEVSIGRVATHKSVRGKGMGKVLMKYCLLAVEREFGNVPVRISAQTYLRQFYLEFGFKETGKSYLEDDIPHTEMYRPSPESPV